MIYKRPLFWVIVCGLIIGLPVLFAGFPFSSHDGNVHEVWYSNFAAQFWAGDLYPRWLQDLDDGLGGPSFFFYPPVPYWFTSLFQPFFRDQPHSWHVLGVSAAFALVLSGVFAYLWLTQLASKRAAAVAAVLYVAMPYHLAIDLHSRGAFGEVWSFVWMPATLFFAQRVVRRDRFAIAGLAISYAMLIMTHMPTTLIFSPIPPLWALWQAGRGERVRGVVLTSVAMALGIGLSAVYLLPAMMDQEWVAINSMRIGDFYYENSFFFPGLLAGDFKIARWLFSEFMFWMVVSTIGIGAFAWYVTRRSNDATIRRAALFWGLIGILTCLMMLPVSKPVYELIRALQMIQFPWRFNAVLAIAVSGLIALGLTTMEAFPVRAAVGALATFAAFVLLWGVFTVAPLENTSFSKNSHLKRGPGEWKANNWNTNEYRPRWVRGTVQDLVARLRSPVTGRIPKARVTNNGGDVAVNQWKPRNIRLLLEGKSEMVVEVGQYYFPGWTATLDQKDSLRVVPSTQNGLVEISVPPGTHTLDLRLKKIGAERWGTMISAAALLLLIFMLTLGVATRREKIVVSTA
ncbi:MAG TPA: 6-pyruvoyl-tetrahydropterin synthase-related protein [Gemmatimonadaceae bacterium]